MKGTMQKKKKTRPTIAMLLRCRSVKAIIAMMKKYGITGYRSNACDCPLANFVKKTGVNAPLVCSINCVGADGKILFKQSKARIKFLAMFDAGQIPELIA